MKLTKFKDTLPIPPVIKPLKRGQDYSYYEINIKEAKQVLPSELPPTTIWGYQGIYPGPTIEVESNEKVYVKWTNELPAHPPGHITTVIIPFFPYMGQ